MKNGWIPCYKTPDNEGWYDVLIFHGIYQAYWNGRSWTKCNRESLYTYYDLRAWRVKIEAVKEEAA